MSRYSRNSPDFVILGMPFPEHNQVMIWASDTLTHAELEMQVESYQSLSGHLAAPTYERIDLTVGMSTITRVVADTYAEALYKLFNSWTPRQDNRQPQKIERPDYRLLPRPKELNG